MLVLDRTFFIDSFEKMAELAEEERNHWSKLDSDIGDGDHGINMTIGFRDVTKKLEKMRESDEDISELLKSVGMSLMSKVGGASGPLYGSFFMRAANDYKGQQEVTFPEFCQIIKNGVDQIIKLGKASVGDKTMIDAFVPGLEVLFEHDLENEPIEAFEAFVNRMKQGSDETIPLVAKRGRAMRLGERAIGFRDPGSESSWMLMNIYLDELKKRV